MNQICCRAWDAWDIANILLFGPFCPNAFILLKLEKCFRCCPWLLLWHLRLAARYFGNCTTWLWTLFQVECQIILSYYITRIKLTFLNSSRSNFFPLWWDDDHRCLHQPPPVHPTSSHEHRRGQWWQTKGWRTWKITRGRTLWGGGSLNDQKLRKNTSFPYLFTNRST